MRLATASRRNQPADVPCPPPPLLRDAVLDHVPVLDGGVPPGGHLPQSLDALQAVRRQPARLVRALPRHRLPVRDELLRTDDAADVS